MQKLVVSASPHIRTDESVPRIMWTVFFALLPAALAGVYYFGAGALLVLVLGVGSSVAAEVLYFILKGKGVQKAFDGSAAVTGLLFSMVISSNVKWYVVVIGAVFAVLVVKQLFGGLGCNIWNPALMGRAFVLAAFASQVAGGWARPFAWTFAPDAMTGATPLDVVKNGLWKAGSDVPDLLALWTGNTGGSIGETCGILLLLGGLFLIWRGYVNWRVPLFYILTVVVIASVFPYRYVDGNPVPLPYDFFGYIIFTAGSGGLMLGAFFMATDMVTSPVTNRGLVVFAIGCGVLTAVIRLAGGYPEGVCYAIILMNTVTPLIDRYTQPKKFGMQVPGTSPGGQKKNA